RKARIADTSPAELREQLDQRTRERDEALEQQAATSKVLQVISSSSGDLEPVFATMLAEAVRICDANFGNIYRWDGHALHLTATHAGRFRCFASASADPRYIDPRHINSYWLHGGDKKDGSRC